MCCFFIGIYKFSHRGPPSQAAPACQSKTSRVRFMTRSMKWLPLKNNFCHYQPEKIPELNWLSATSCHTVRMDKSYHFYLPWNIAHPSLKEGNNFHSMSTFYIPLNSSRPPQFFSDYNEIKNFKNNLFVGLFIPLCTAA